MSHPMYDLRAPRADFPKQAATACVYDALAKREFDPMLGLCTGSEILSWGTGQLHDHDVFSAIMAAPAMPESEAEAFTKSMCEEGDIKAVDWTKLLSYLKTVLTILIPLIFDK